MGSLIDFRNRIMMPFIDRGLDVNQHIRDFYTWSPSSSSSYPTVLVELIRNGLSNFDTSSRASLAPILIFEACSHLQPSERRWGKVRLLLKLIHRLGASCATAFQQVETGQHILRVTKEHIMPEARLHPIIDCLKNIAPHYRSGAQGQAHDELALFQEQRQHQLRLGDFARISVRQAVEGQHFLKQIQQLPLPCRMKSYLNADFTAQLSRRVFQ